MRRRCVTIQRRGRYSRQEVASAALELREAAGEPTALAFAFITPDYVPHIEEFSEMVRVDGHVIELVGATGAGFTVDGEENEEGGGFAWLALGARDGAVEVRACDVTREETNVVYALRARPADDALESAFEGLTEGEKAGAKGNLFAGLAGTEYVEDFKPGDFLIRNILGADPNSGAVAIGGFPRVGQ